MRCRIRKIGNFRGVLIPASFLAACGIEGEIELRLEGKRIIIEPFCAHRNGWFDRYQPERDRNAWSGLVESDEDAAEWQW